MAEKGKHMRETENKSVDTAVQEEKVVYITPPIDDVPDDEDCIDDEYLADDYYDPFSGGILGGLLDALHSIGEEFKGIWRKSKEEVDENEARKLRMKEARLRENDDVLVISGAVMSDIDKVASRIMDNVPDVGLAVECIVAEPAQKPDGSMQVNGEDYFFISVEEFRRRVDFDEFMYSVEIDDIRYGCPKDYISYLRLMGKRTILLKALPDDAAFIKKLYPAVTTVFVLPPDKKEVIRRLNDEGITDADAVNEKLKDVAWSLENADEFDKLVSGTDDEQTACEIANIIYSRRNSNSNRRKELAQSIASFGCGE